MIGEAEVTGEPGKVGLAVGDPLQRQADPQPVPVLAHGQPGEPGENPAQVVRRAAGHPAERDQPEPRIGGQCRLGLAHHPPPRRRGGRAAASGAFRQPAREQRGSKPDHVLGQAAIRIATAGHRGEAPHRELAGRIHRQHPVRGHGVAAGQRGEQARIERDGRADVPAGNWMSELLDQPGRAQVRDRAVDEGLGGAFPAQECAAPRGDQQVPAFNLGRVEPRRAAGAAHVGDAETVAHRQHCHLVHG